MLTSRGNQRLAGAFLVAAHVFFLAHSVTYALDKASATVLLILLYGLFVVLSAMTLYLTFARLERTVALLGASGLAVHGIFMVAGCALLLARFDLAAELTPAGGSEPESVAAIARALELAVIKLRFAAFVFLSLGMLALGGLIARSGAVARWLGWLGVVGGIVGVPLMLASLLGIDLGGSADIPTMAVFLPALVFLIGLGVRLLAREVGEGNTATRA